MRKLFLLILFVLFFANSICAKDNATEYYLEAARILRDSHSPKLLLPGDVHIVDDEIKTILNNPAHDPSSVSDLLKTFSKIDEALVLLRKGTETKVCQWQETNLRDSILWWFTDAYLLNYVAWLKFVDLVNHKQYDEAVAVWNDAMLLSRCITFSKGIVCHLSGMKQEQLGMAVISTYLPQFQNAQIKKILTHWQALPPRPLSHESVLADCSFGIRQMKTYPVSFFLEVGYESPIPLGSFGDISTPIEMEDGIFKYSITDCIGAIYCFCAVDVEVIEKTIDEYVDCIAVPFSEFDKKHEEFWVRLESLENSCNREVLFSLIPAARAMKHAEQKMSIIESAFQKELQGKLK